MVYPNVSLSGARIYCEPGTNCSKEFDVLQTENGNNLTSTQFNPEEFVKLYLGERRINYVTVCLLTFIYVTIFLSGLIGNMFTVIVILKNVYMRSVTNYYLLSLSTADLLTIVFGKFVVCNHPFKTLPRLYIHVSDCYFNRRSSKHLHEDFLH